MEDQILQVHMFGELSLQYKNNIITDRSSRSKKIRVLLAYMICRRNQTVTARELTELLWQNDPLEMDTKGALKTVFFRLRSLLDHLEPDLGKKLIILKDGNYAWNPQIPIYTDCEEFESLCQLAAITGDPQTRLSLQLQALDLYRGAFLAHNSSELWVMTTAEYYKGLYEDTMLKALLDLESQSQHLQAAELCRSAIRNYPDNENFSVHLMKNLLARGDDKAAAAEYSRITGTLNRSSGARPSEPLIRLYRQAISTKADGELLAEQVVSQLAETNMKPGALVCDYNVFREIYHAAARSAARSGQHIQLLIVSYRSSQIDAFSGPVLAKAMDSLQEIIRLSIRTTDIISRCSSTQFVIMLPLATEDNVQVVCERLSKAYLKRHPHRDAWLEFSSHSVEPARANQNR